MADARSLSSSWVSGVADWRLEWHYARKRATKPGASQPTWLVFQNRSKIGQPAHYCVAFLDVRHATGATLEGEQFDNQSTKGKVVLFQFWTTWCPYCKGEESLVNEITKEFADKGLIVLAVDVAEVLAPARASRSG